jgi:protease-4
MSEPIRPSDLVRNTWLTLRNGVRSLQRTGMEYVVLRVQGSYPELTVQPRRRFPLSLIPWPPPPPSVEAFTNTLDLLAGDRRVKGVVLIISQLQAQPATVESLRQAVLRFRQSGKRALAHLHTPDTWSYYFASACDEILAPESASFRAAGLWAEVLFLKDTLALVGIEADFEAIAEYKVTPDTYRRATMTKPHREMLESLLDSLYTRVVDGIANGRGLAPERVQELLDSMPLSAEQALAAGLFDHICYEDELPGYLGTPEAPAALLTGEQARRRLIYPRRWYSLRSVGVISLEGMIVVGASHRSPVPVPTPLRSSQAGSDTLVQQLRAAGRDKRLAAVVLHIDSPGGSALASDLIWREVAHLRQIKPVVVYMSNRAASGGYYVSAPANAIVAQPTTLTGSIGIWGGKVVTKGLFDKVRAGRAVVSRGKSAGLYADLAPFSDEERAKIRADIGTSYRQFLARVAQGRGLTEEEAEAIARGRVWTGEQALAHGLVDELGDMQAAADKARELAGLDPRRHAPLVNVPPPKQTQLPVAAPAEAGEWVSNLTGLLREGVFALAPWALWLRS